MFLSARQYLHIEFHAYMPGKPFVFHIPSLYNPSRRLIEFDSPSGLTGDCRFKTRNMLECQFFLLESRLSCAKFTMSRTSNDEVDRFIADNWFAGDTKIENSFLENIQLALGGPNQ
jgi:hypothetical protein